MDGQNIQPAGHRRTCPILRSQDKQSIMLANDFI